VGAPRPAVGVLQGGYDSSRHKRVLTVGGARPAGLVPVAHLVLQNRLSAGAASTTVTG